MAEQSVYARYEAAFGDLEPLVAFVDLDALWANAEDMVRQAGDKPIRVASKSVRCRPLLPRIFEERIRSVLTALLGSTTILLD